MDHISAVFFCLFSYTERRMFYLSLTSISLFILLIFGIEVQATATKHIIVKECPSKNVNQLRREAKNHDLSFLFYYVSWSKRALKAHLIFNSFAESYQDLGYFAAFDCYHLQCNCSRTHQTIQGSGAPHKWPTLIVNIKKVSLQYHGNWQLDDLTRFIANIIKPIDRVHNGSDLLALSRESDAIVFGFCQNANSLDYIRFVIAAIKWLEIDPERSLRFAIAFGKNYTDIIKIENATMPLLVLIDSLNKARVYNSTNAWQANHIVNWVQSNLNSIYMHNNGYSSPNAIPIKMRKSAVLVLSVNPRPYEKHLYYLLGQQMYSNKRALIKQYNNCYKGICSSALDIKPSLGIIYKLLQTNLTVCQRLFNLNRQTWTHYYRYNNALNFLWFSLIDHSNIKTNDEHKDIHRFFEIQRRFNCLGQTQQQPVTSPFKIALAKFIKHTALKVLSQTDVIVDKNRTLSVVLLDTVRHQDFLQEHQITTNMESAANAFIIDAKSERIYTMEKKFSYQALIEFIKSYYLGNVTRIIKSSSILPSPSNAQYIATYNRQLLLQVLKKENVTNVVMLYTPLCALSAIMSQALLQLAFLFESEEISFIRLNTKTNDLPWELVMPSSPNLIIFPALNAIESRFFPAHLKVNVRNLMGFILAQVQPEIQLRLVLNVCKHTRQIESCLEYAKILVMQHIGNHLKFWEIYKSERNVILTHLSDFNDIHTELQSGFRI